MLSNNEMIVDSIMYIAKIIPTKKNTDSMSCINFSAFTFSYKSLWQIFFSPTFILAEYCCLQI